MIRGFLQIHQKGTSTVNLFHTNAMINYKPTPCNFNRKDTNSYFQCFPISVLVSIDQFQLPSRFGFNLVMISGIEYIVADGTTINCKTIK